MLSPDLASLSAIAVYAVVWGFLFAECGLLLGFLLPGDTILFGAGLLAAAPQSDVNTMSRSLGVPPWGIGLMLIVPAFCDTYRYFVPNSRWAPWVSLAGKLSMVGAALTF